MLLMMIIMSLPLLGIGLFFVLPFWAALYKMEIGGFGTSDLTLNRSIPCYPKGKLPASLPSQASSRCGGRAVTMFLFEIASASRPRLRYAIGGERCLPYLKVLLPQFGFDYLLRRGFKLPRSHGGYHR